MPLTGPHRVDCHAEGGACHRSPDLPFASAAAVYAAEIDDPHWSRVELVCCATQCPVWVHRGGVAPQPRHRKGA